MNMWQTMVGNDMSLYSIRFRVPSRRFTVGYAEKWLAINVRDVSEARYHRSKGRAQGALARFRYIR